MHLQDPVRRWGSTNSQIGSRLRDMVATLSQFDHPLAFSALLKTCLLCGCHKGLNGWILGAVTLMSFCLTYDARQLLTSSAFGFIAKS